VVEVVDLLLGGLLAEDAPRRAAGDAVQQEEHDHDDHEDHHDRLQQPHPDVTGHCAVNFTGASTSGARC
jgi:hypothetical protein